MTSCASGVSCWSCSAVLTKRIRPILMKFEMKAGYLCFVSFCLFHLHFKIMVSVYIVCDCTGCPVTMNRG